MTDKRRKYDCLDKQIKQLYESGKSLTETAKELGMTYSSVHRHLIKMQIKRRQIGTQKGFKRSQQNREHLSQSKSGEKNPRWQGNKVKANAGRLRANRQFGNIKGYEKHHIDGNPLNNSPENIAFVTRKEHMLLDGRLSKRDKTGKFSEKCGLVRVQSLSSLGWVFGTKDQGVVKLVVP